MRRRKLVATIVATAGTLAVAVAAAAAATAVVVGGGWQPFSWGGGDGATVGEAPFTYQADEATVVTVTDVFCTGDRLTLTDNGTVLGTTSAPAGPPSCASDVYLMSPDLALDSPQFSHGRFAVGAGSHEIGITASTSPFGGGVSYIRIDALTKEMCRDDGWKEIEPFRNLGDCISLVASGGAPLTEDSDG